MEIRGHIEQLFRYIGTYETSYSDFDAEAFIRTYEGARAVFKALREHRDEAVETDYCFLDFIQQSPLTSSDLRKLTVQLLITYFEMEADEDGRCNQAYKYIRTVRPVKQDVGFFEDHLLPVLFQQNAVNGNYLLHKFFLREIARFINRYGRALRINLSPEEFEALSEPRKLLELCRRRLELGQGLTDDSNSLEIHLRRVGVFKKLSRRSRLFDLYLSDWKYLEKVTFWSKLRRALSSGFGKFRGIFTSLRYTRLVLSQRRAAYFAYTIAVLLWIAVAVLTPILWSAYNESKYQELEERARAVEEHALPH
jgi:hypothetical protein